MKGTRKLQIATILLVIVVISLISFVGIYVKDKNKMSNIMREYQLGTNLKGGRVVHFKVSKGVNTTVYDKDGKIIENPTEEDINKEENTKTQTPKNADEVFNSAYYETCKTIIENRLIMLGIPDYSVSYDVEAGDIFVQLPEDTQTDYIVGELYAPGKFEIVDKEDEKTVLMTNADLQKVSVGYGQESQTSTATRVYMVIQFNEEGTKKLEEITKKYISSTDESGTETKKQITLKLDDSTLLSTYFSEPITNGKLQLSIGQSSSNSEDLQKYALQASSMSMLLQSGKLPIIYEIAENQYIASSLTQENLIVAMIAGAVIIGIAFIYLIVRYRGLGLLSVFCNIGIAAIILLLIRYTNVVVTIEGAFALGVILILNYAISILTLNRIKRLNPNGLEDYSVKQAIKESYLKSAVASVSIFVIAVVFCFIKWYALNSFGMILFWGIVTTMLFNLGITRTLYIAYAQSINKKK